MQHKKIVHLNFAKGFRGGESQTQLLIKELANRGYKQKLIVRQNSVLANNMEGTNNLEIIKLKKPYAFYLASIKNASILHAHETKAAQFCFFANFFYKIPYIITRRVDIAIKNNFFNKGIYINSTKTIVLSKAIQVRVKKLSTQVETLVIPDASTIHKTNQENILKLKKRFHGKFIIGNIAALEIEKGQQYILELAKKTQVIHPEIHFIFLGTGKDEDLFKDKYQKLNNISFEGFVNNIGDYLSIFDIFIFPTLNEGFGSSILDAMQFKLPIAASNVGGIPDIIKHNHNGLLFPPKDSNAIFHVIEQLYLSKKLRDKLSHNSFNNIENFSYEVMATRYLELYKSIDDV